MQEFEKPVHMDEDAPEHAKIRSKKMEKIGYKGDNAVEADEVPRLQCVVACRV